MNDPLGDLLTRIRNAQMRRRPKVSTPGVQAARACARCACLRGVYPRLCPDRAQGNLPPELEIELKYSNGQPAIREIKRVSTPGRRVYSAVRDLGTVANGLGVSILSTPKGVMSDSRAREENVGGEILCSVF